MANIRSIDAGHYRIPLDVALTDSTHGVMTAFEIVTVRVTDTDGIEGVGYTYTTGRNGGAIYSIVKDEIAAVAKVDRSEDEEVEYQQDEEGNLILDEEGNPIPVATAEDGEDSEGGTTEEGADSSSDSTQGEESGTDLDNDSEDDVE